MKINWGTGIVVLYTGFVAMILVLVGMSVSQKIDLVTDHYYEEELQFQDRINKIKRTTALANSLTWTVDELGIRIQYPYNMMEEPVSGVIKLYCPSDDKKDRTFKILPVNNEQFIPSSKILAGNYHLQIDWEIGNQTYWNEDVIVISHSK